MNPVTAELTVLCGMFAAGMCAGALYDVSRLIRLLFKKGAVRDAVFDTVFCAAAGALCALALTALNGGVPRLYAIFAYAGGALAYNRTAGAAVAAAARRIHTAFTNKRSGRGG